MTPIQTMMPQNKDKNPQVASPRKSLCRTKRRLRNGNPKDLIIPSEDDTIKPDERESKDGTEDSKQAAFPDVDQPKKAFCLIDLISGGRTNLNCWWCWIALLAALAAIAGGVVWKVKCGKEQE